MGGLPVKSESVPLDTERAKNGTERQVQIQQHRPLFDVQFKVSCGVLEFFPAFFYAFKIDADFLQRVRQPDALLVLEYTRLVHV